MSVFAIVEVANPDQLIAGHGAETYEGLQAELVDRLRSWIRKQDQLAVDKSGRICVLLKGLSDQGQINLAANKLMRITAPLYECFGEHVRMPVEAGFAFTLPRADTREAALARASAALHQAREQGESWATYEADSTSVRSDEHKLVRALHRAVDLGEFVLFFQPKVNAAYRTLVGAEALIRWIPDAQQVITPDRFIDVAERHGVIKPITLWAVKSAIARCVSWQGDAGVAVNVPPTVLKDRDLFSTVQDCLSLYSLEASRLTLEITETVMASNQAQMFEHLAEFRSLGVRVAIDDFGTGYSSLAYFRDMPADELKIDKCFVDSMQKSERDLAIVKTIIELGRNFSMQVVAEGVEDEASAQKLLDLGCHVLQGYLIDKPLPPEDFELRHHLRS